MWALESDQWESPLGVQEQENGIFRLAFSRR